MLVNKTAKINFFLDLIKLVFVNFFLQIMQQVEIAENLDGDENEINIVKKQYSGGNGISKVDCLYDNKTYIKSS